MARLLSSIGSYAYSEGENTLFVHLYLGGDVQTSFGYALHCETEYPHFGEVKYRFAGAADTTVALRIPARSARRRKSA